MKYYVEQTFEDFEPWAGAVSTHRRIIDEGKADEADAYFDEMTPADGWTDTAINDVLWFESDALYSALGMKPDTTTTHTADEIGAAWVEDNKKYGGYNLIRVEMDADAVRIVYRDEIDEDETSPDTCEEVEEMTAEDVAALFGDDCGEIDAEAGTVETWEK